MSAIKAWLLRTLVIMHRYLGIGIGWLLVLWCVSGLVMMYVPYPSLQSAQRYAALPTLDTQHCCRLPSELLDDDLVIAALGIESLAGHTVLEVAPDFGATLRFDLRAGVPVEAVTEVMALQVAQQYLQSSGHLGAPRLLDLIEQDQWTVYASFDAARPLYHLALHDPPSTELYVSSTSGRIVQKTQRWQRFWNWLGAVPHWLYFTTLRQHTVLWAQIVIYAAVLGAFLTAFGLYLGVLQLRRRTQQWHSPYRGWKYWHHVPGLLFGVLVLSWVVSGLLSMNPWGWLETSNAREAYQLRGAAPTWTTVRTSLAKLPQAKLPLNTVSVQASVLHGELFYLLSKRNGEQQRLTAEWQPAPLAEQEIQQAAATLGGAWRWLTHEDEYYFSHGQQRVSLPVLRVDVDDEQGTRYYLDALTGQLIAKVDANARWYRWLHYGLHRLDFSAALRSRPFWDLLMWFTLLGVTLVCITGFWLGVRRLRGRA